MFVTEVGAVLTTGLTIAHSSLFGWLITGWLWLTVVFANLAEAVAESRGKAQADSLRRTRQQTTARRLTGWEPGVDPARCAEETVPEAIVAALKSGQLAGYAGDVWFPQPPPADHPWRTMPNNAMTPHVSGTTLSAQARYAAGTREILECWFPGLPIRPEYLIVDGGKLAGAGAHSYSVGTSA